MCMVSNVGDAFGDNMKPWINPVHPYYPYQPQPFPTVQPEGVGSISLLKPDITREEFDELKVMVEQLRVDLQKAIAYDKETNQPDCQNEEKYKVLRAVAEALGMTLDDILPKPKQ